MQKKNARDVEEKCCCNVAVVIIVQICVLRLSISFSYSFLNRCVHRATAAAAATVVAQTKQKTQEMATASNAKREKNVVPAVYFLM